MPITTHAINIVNFANSISPETLYFILFAPVITTFIVAARQLIGIRGVGISTPLLLVFLLSQTGMLAGLFIIGITLGMGILLKILLRHIHLLYLPRTGLLFVNSMVSVLIFIMLWLTFFNNESFHFIPIAFVAAFVLTENFFATQRPALHLCAEVIILVLGGFALFSIQILRNLFLLFPWAPFTLSTIALVFLGKWTGLRMLEYIRFRDFFKHV